MSLRFHDSLVSWFRTTRTLTGLMGLLFISLVISLPIVAQTTRFVSTTGTNSNPATATSWATSTTNLQGAINSLSATGGQVWVATGTYKPNDGYDRDAFFSMRNGVAIYGGFVGTETSLGSRPISNLTIPSSTTLSGDVGIIDNPTDNSFHIIKNSPGLNSTALLNGFVITLGNTSGIFPDYYGGGIYNDGSGAGNACSPKIDNCWFVNNSASEGGALYNNGNGGGNSNVQISNCLFLNNTATSYGGAVENDGGNGGTNTTTFTNCIFRNNTAPSTSGGAVYNFGAVGNSNPRFINCAFLSNAAASGGAMYNDASNGGTSSPQLINCSLGQNTATNGGALYNYTLGGGSSNPQLLNCILFGNGGANTFVNNPGTAVVSASYSLFEPSVTGYTNVTGNVTTILLPFSSATTAQLANGSPAINAGSPASTSTTVAATDLFGNPRFYQGGRIDMGAVELQEALEIHSVLNGNWNTAAIWSVGRLPAPGERVRLGHFVTITTGYQALAGTILYNATGKLLYEPGGHLQLNP